MRVVDGCDYQARGGDPELVRGVAPASEAYGGLGSVDELGIGCVPLSPAPRSVRRVDGARQLLGVHVHLSGIPAGAAAYHQVSTVDRTTETLVRAVSGCQ
ncbi:hypothetical protein [Streptomyces aureus]|uniref:Uncharacterized protein n=1 Tax=Streptomyces aureus TaxID=193461 RepID=A0ABV4SZS3_9ACTN